MSRNISAWSQFGSLLNEYSFAACSATNNRSVPGAFAITVGFLNLSLGNAFSVRYGRGGSGLPRTRDVVHGTRSAMPYSHPFNPTSLVAFPTNSSVRWEDCASQASVAEPFVLDAWTGMDVCSHDVMSIEPISVISMGEILVKIGWGIFQEWQLCK